MHIHLSRRRILWAALALPTLSINARAAAPWSYRILVGPQRDGWLHLGLHVKLAHGWKTYWRVPGDGGIPPSITMTGKNITSFEFECPLPTRFSGSDGETIGYKDEVVFPIRVQPEPDAIPTDLRLEAFLGVCETVCIPAQIQDVVELDVNDPDAELLQQWQLRVPLKSTTGPVSHARFTNDSLELKVSGPVSEIFVEVMDGTTPYVGKPEFDIAQGIARLTVRGLAHGGTLKGHQIRVTSVVGSSGVEQRLTVV